MKEATRRKRRRRREEEWTHMKDYCQVAEGGRQRLPEGLRHPLLAETSETSEISSPKKKKLNTFRSAAKQQGRATDTNTNTNTNGDDESSDWRDTFPLGRLALEQAKRSGRAFVAASNGGTSRITIVDCDGEVDVEVARASC